MPVNRYCKQFYTMASDYICKQRLPIRCVALVLDDDRDLYSFSFTYEGKTSVQTMDKSALELEIHPELLIKYLCNKAAYELTNN